MRSDLVFIILSCGLITACDTQENRTLAVKKCTLGVMNCEEHEVECDDKRGKGRPKCTQDEHSIEVRVLNPSTIGDAVAHFGTVRGEPKTLYFEVRNVTADPIREFSINLPDPDRLGKALEIVDTNCPYKKKSTDEFRLGANQSCQFGLKLTPMDHPDLAYARINELDVSGEVSIQGTFKKKKGNDNAKSKVAKKEDDKGYIDQRVSFDGKLVHGVASVATSSSSSSSSSSNSASTTCAYSGSWSQSLSWTNTSGQDSWGAGLAIASDNSIYVSGLYGDSNQYFHWVVRKSSDSGSTWTTVDDYQYATNATAAAQGLLVHSSGKIFAVGYAAQSAGSSNYHWIVRRSADSGSTWATVDDFNLSGTLGDAARGILETADGSIYVTGSGLDGSGTNWITRKSSDSGSTWTTVDTYQYQVSKASWGMGLATVSSSLVYAVGVTLDSSSKAHCSVRKYDGSSWSLVDQYQQTNSQHCYGNGIAVATDGTVYWTGRGIDGTSVSHLVTRKSSNAGSTWSTIDDYQYSSGEASGGANVLVSSVLGILVKGMGTGAGAYFLRRSADSGNTWTLHDSSSTGISSETNRGISVDSSGNIYSGNGSSVIGVRKISCN